MWETGTGFMATQSNMTIEQTYSAGARQARTLFRRRLRRLLREVETRYLSLPFGRGMAEAYKGEIEWLARQPARTTEPVSEPGGIGRTKAPKAKR